MWEATIAGAGGLMSLYVALRREVRRSHELVQKDLELVRKDIGHLQDDNGRLEQGLTELRSQILTDVRSDLRRLDQKIDAVRGELIGFLGPR
jgi:chromosome segregation ATPase